MASNLEVRVRASLGVRPRMNPGRGGRLTLEMAFETLKCSHCGAIPKDSGTKFCGFCGSLLPLRTPTAGSPIEAPERFEAVERHPDMPRLLSRVPEDPKAPSVAPGIVFLAAIVVVTVAMFSQRPGPPPFVLIVPGIAALPAIAQIVHAVRRRSGPIHRNVAVVLDERMKVSGGGQDSSARTKYYVLLADRSGSRLELEATGDVAGQTARGDIGVAYVRHGRLVDFAVVRT